MDDKWYTFVDGKYQLTPEAPPEAQRSFAEWHTEPKIPLRRKLLRLRAKFF